MPMYSSQFNQIFVDNAAGTLTELSQHARLINGRVTYDDRDASTFATGGVAIAEKHGRGALNMNIEVEWIHSDTLAMHLRQIYASIVGFTVRVIKGSNAAPTFGDEVWQMEGTFYSLAFAPTPGQDVRYRTTFMLVDGAPTPEVTRY